MRTARPGYGARTARALPCAQSWALLAAVAGLLQTATVLSQTGPLAYVASWGSDANPCTVVSPCRSFAVAVASVDDGGAVTALDSAGYGAVTVTRSVRIEAPAGQHVAISAFPGQDGVAVSLVGSEVVLRGLTIRGHGGGNGIAVTGIGRVSIEHCRVSGMGGSGIDLRGSGVTASIKDTYAYQNSSRGVTVDSGAHAELERVTLEFNALGGLQVSNAASAIANDASIARNGYGVRVENQFVAGESRLTLTRSVVTGNFNFGVGVHADSGFRASASIAQTQVVGNPGSGVLSQTGPNGLSIVTLTRSVVSGNGAYGARASGPTPARLVVSRTTIAGNALEGLSQLGAAEVRSTGDNALHDNNGGGAQTSGTISALAPL